MNRIMIVKERCALGVTQSLVANTGQNAKMHKGLSEKEARNKLLKHGLNTITARRKISAFGIIFDQFSDFMVLILLASTAISAFMGEITEAVTIVAIVVLNAILGFIQEYKTERTLDALKSLAAPTANVIRDGVPVSIPAEEVVPGDLIILEAGDRVPADAILVESNSLQVDEALLTGESVPVEKIPDSGNKRNLVYMGTVVTCGRGRALVQLTGMNTEMGKIADMIQSIEDEDTPLQKRLEHLGKFIVYGCLIICAIVSLTGYLRGEALFTMLLAGISLAVAAVPEGLPAIVTISLALGVQRMLKRNALIRKLPAVETLGCASVICSDKTGTLTENKMTVRRIYSGGSMTEINGRRHSAGEIFSSGGNELNPPGTNPVKLALEIGVVCNNAGIVKTSDNGNAAMAKIKSLFSRKETWKINGDPTEGALLVAAEKAGLSREALDKVYLRIDELPFDSDRKCMSVICGTQKGERLVFTKGAPDMIMDKCNRIYGSHGITELSAGMKKDILKVNDSMAADALRVLAVAYKQLNTGSLFRNEIEKDLIFVGLIGMIDPPRREAIEAVQKCKMAGIKPVMITGDHKITAMAVGRELNIYEAGNKVLTGSELEGMNEARLMRMANDVSIYARVSPKHKLMIVRVLKRLGHIVAMTGDGVNDAPAIKEADIGVSMGVTGTDVTKEASSMILLDDNFATIVAAVEEGRVIYNNIRKFIRYMLACNIGEVLTMFLGMLIGLPLPLLPIQILWVNLVTDGLPAIALGLDPPEKDVMMRPPRGMKENVFSHGMLSVILFRGILIGLSTLAVFTSILYFTGDVNASRTGAFITLVVTQLIHVFECKSERKTIFEIPIFNNMPLVLAVVCSLVMLLGVIYIPPLQEVFKTAPVGLNEWTLIAGFTALGPVLASFFRVGRK